ncbi:uncharacterized protein LOC122947293 isoform X1 [Acropora millepora]|uniref:uncharacterized protein LOC122947293 isoform X1 n=1 Tax=Acropora millepora TaxID=45264 RepID=UPI001CF3F5A3|nr:uncharacterized protein LOC122947293 isoform X1 [Acropora millepora]
MFRASVSVAVIFLLARIHMISGECPKHEALLHNFKPMYYIDQRETIQLWAKVIPERWQDNRLIGSLSNTDFLAFNLTSWETSSETQGIGVTTRDVRSRETQSKNGCSQEKVDSKAQGGIQRLLLLSS